MHSGGEVVDRRGFIALLLAGAALIAKATARADGQRQITVWRDPSCGCCGKWVDHLRLNGFTAKIVETSNVQAIKGALGVPQSLASCHTASIDRYVIEGHVPAVAILRLLSERPAGRGLAVPGMPVGSPGMEGGTPEPYDVILFGDGEPRTFARFVGDTAT